MRGPADLPGMVAAMNAAEVADGIVRDRDRGGARQRARDTARHFVPERDVLLAELDGRIVAISHELLSIRDGVRVYDSYGHVHPDVRRRGIGRAMLRHAETPSCAGPGRDRGRHARGRSSVRGPSRRRRRPSPCSSRKATRSSAGSSRWTAPPADPLPGGGAPGRPRAATRPTRSTCGRSWSPTRRPSRITGERGRSPRREIRAGRGEPAAPTRACGWSPGTATRWPDRSWATSSPTTTRPPASSAAGSTG